MRFFLENFGLQNFENISEDYWKIFGRLQRFHRGNVQKNSRGNFGGIRGETIEGIDGEITENVS